MSEYTEQAETFLKSHGLGFRSVFVGNDCPKFCEDAANGKDMDKVDTFPRKSHIHGKHYRCTISGENRGHVSFDFWNSYADEEFNYFRTHSKPQDSAITDRMRRAKQPSKTVNAYDLLACITKSDPDTFKNFCSDSGYSDDSMKAFGVYQDAQDEYSKVRRFFTAAELEQIQDIS
jgi:hypothetical protein